MKKNVVIFFVFLAATAVALLLYFKNDNAGKSEKSSNNPAEKNEMEKEVASKLSSALGRAMKNAKPEELERVFNEKTELTPLPFDEVEKLEGENLQKRVQELDAKLDHAVQTNPDLPPPPEWYLREKEYLFNKFFATVGKSRYRTEMTEEQKERQQR
ncbi:MAG TPA: hypothetical protein P5044_04090, partial [bacterium]|nr:hypothetical protein [bacterium]